MSISHITEENFAEVDPNLLLDPKWYSEVEAMVLSIDAADTADYAKIFAVMLGDKLAQVGVRMSSDLKEKYFVLLKTLRLCALESTPDPEKETFFSELILDTFKLEFVNIRGKVENLFRGFYDDSQTIEHYRSLFVKALEKNQESLGGQNLLVDNGSETRTLKPSLGNWLTDYNFSSHLSADTHRRGSFEQTNYFLHSENVKKLTKEDRDVLLRLLQFYDWLRFEPFKFDFRLPDQEPWDEETFDFTKPEKVIPVDLVDLIEKLRAAPEGNTTSVQGLNYMSKQNGVMKEPESTKPAPSLRPVESQRPTFSKMQKPPVSSPARPAVASPLIKRSAEPRTLMDIKADIENKKRKAQEEIDRKLEELKRKVQK